MDDEAVLNFPPQIVVTGFCARCAAEVEFDRCLTSEYQNGFIQRRTLSYLCFSCYMAYSVESDSWDTEDKFTEACTEMEEFLQIDGDEANLTDADDNGHL